MDNRVEDFREKFLAKKREMLSQVPEITAKLLEGPEYFEEEFVDLKNGKRGKTKVYPLTVGQFEKFLTKYKGIDFGNLELSKDYPAIIEMASTATRRDESEIKEYWVRGSAMSVAITALRITGFGSGDEPESFRE